MQGELHRALPAAAALRVVELLLALPLLIGPAAVGQPLDRALEPAVARAYARGGDAVGNVFFTQAAGGVVAVGAAHSFDGTELAEAGELEFRAAGSAETAARSSRYFAAPGKPFHRQGATLRDDFVVLLLRAPPIGLRTLPLAVDRPAVGASLRVLGIPREGGGAEREIAGVVVSSEPTAIEAELEEGADLRGWGGAPVLDGEGRVVGMLHSARPVPGGLRIGVGPIEGVRKALEDPFEGGLGRLFTTLAPPPSAANDSGGRRRRATGSPFGTLDPRVSAARVRAAALAASAARPQLAPETLFLDIERPRAGVELGTPHAFVSGHAVGLEAGRRRFDVMVVIDTSKSTGEPAGVDVDGDGEVGTAIPLEDRHMLEPGSTDPEDTILAAEVAAAQRLLDGLDPRTTRVGIATFAGVPTLLDAPGGMKVSKAAITQEPLTADYRRLRLGLERVRDAGSHGMTHMAAGADLAILELLGLSGSISRPEPESEKVILFFTDGEPTLPYTSDAPNVRAVLGSAQRARQTGVRIHTFALGPTALARPIATVEMAAISRGIFTPVRHPATLGEFVDQLSFARIERIEVHNETSGQPAHHARLHPDGSWDALVPLLPGENEIAVTAHTELGEGATERVRVRYAKGAEDPMLPAELLPRYNTLLSMRLESIQTERLEIMRKELVIEMEEERKKALRRAEAQRKELEIDATPW